MRRLVLHALVCLPVWLLTDTALADVFLLSNGGRVEGELLNPEESPRKGYRVKTASGGVITLAAGQVKEVVRESEAELWYKRILPKMPNTAEGNWIMARECERITSCAGTGCVECHGL